MSKINPVASNPDFRANVGIMLINQYRQVLAGESIYYPDEWMMPQGGIDENETPQKAMQRELLEETGIEFSSTRLVTEHQDWLSYLFRAPLVKDGDLYIGQRQKWFLLEYQGPAPDASKTPDQEFRQLAWVEPQWLIRHTVPYKVNLYNTVFSSFEPFFP